MQKFKGVTTVQRTIGGMIFLKWADPRQTPAKPKFKSSKTDQTAIAERIASEISNLIYGPVENWRKPPTGLHPRTYALWNATDEVQQAVNSLPVITKSFVANLPEDRSLWNDDNPEYVQVVKMMEAEDQIRKLLEELAMTRSERDTYREHLKLCEGQLRKMDAKIIRTSGRRQLETAIDDYFESKDGTSASGMWRNTLLCWCNRLMDDFGKAQDVREISAEELIKHIEKFETSSGNKKQLTNNLCKFLTWATDGQFDARLVKKSIIKNLPRQNEEWYWLTNVQALAIIENLKKPEFGQYWSDLATIQYACGFRPEEMPILQTSKVKINSHAEIALACIFDKQKLVRRVKTDRSEDTIMVPSFARDALARRLEVKEFLLFPCYDDNQFFGENARKARTTFEKKNKLWSPADDSYCCFSGAYLPRLKAAVTGVEGVALEKVDSRIFRRTCARELILKYGFERAASVIRDSIDTLRKHYADLKSSDTSTER